MLTSIVLVTAHCGPGKLATAVPYTGVTEYNLDLPREMVTFKADGMYHEFDLHAVATVTDTIANGLHTVVISE